MARLDSTECVLRALTVFDADAAGELLHMAVCLQLHNVVDLVNTTKNRKGTNNWEATVNLEGNVWKNTCNHTPVWTQSSMLYLSPLVKIKGV